MPACLHRVLVPDRAFALSRLVVDPLRVHAVAAPRYVRAFPISSAFCLAVRTSLASLPNCFPAALMLRATSEKSVWR